ncbi:uncharacterized protein LOC113005669 [Solenopsis invicta]|uniref:uncharacterized protein LOC113005669 n=1 Tax=Solenopsis invicta TaxID=13686 RepID=UPI00193D8CEA|nr:uncharacterized protein LOC113005669 [Solenopsis invicta]
MGFEIVELQQDGIKLTDVNTGEEPIALLIDADIAGKLLTGKRKELKCGAVALETLLGWTLIGRIDIQPKQKENTTLLLVSMFTQEKNIADLWKLDTLGITDPVEQKTKDAHQEYVKENFRQTIKANTDGRYEVLLPWKEDHPSLVNNKNLAIKRLESTTKKLKAQELYNAYQEVFDDWLLEGIIEKVPDEEIDKDAYYLPHRGVIKESSTTKIRPVFDASAIGENLHSLNHCLETGPNLIELIPRILLRFRRRKVGVTADIRKAFLQISVSPDNRDVLRFLWWKKTQPDKIEEGEYIEYHLERIFEQIETQEEKDIVRHLKKAFYVDNCVTSVNSRSEAIVFETTARQFMAKAQKVFNPIGVSSPISLKPKLLLQKLWSRKIGWDNEVPEDIRSEFNKWQQQLEWLKELCIPRWAFAHPSKVTSGTNSKDDNPTFGITCATIGARLWHSIKDAEDFEEVEVLFWSDSATVLAWIQNNRPWNTFIENRVKEIRSSTDPGQWRHIPGSLNPADLPSRGCEAKQLVESRWWEGPTWLKLSADQWPSSKYSENEAEIVSEIKKFTCQNRKKVSSDNISEINAHISIHQEEARWYMKRQSRYLRIIRTIAWIRRFITNSRTQQTSRFTGELSTKEFIDAELTVLKLTQEESFNRVNESRLNTLDTYYDERGLLRLKSAVVNQVDEYNFKYPIILDPKHPMVKKLIEYTHQQLKHAVTQVVMNNLRETFWILTCRAAVRSVINSCWMCRRYKVKRAETIPGCLPKERVKEANVFEVLGIDYIGPLFLKKG